MTEPRAEGPYEIVVERLPGGRGNGARAGAVAALIVVILAGAIVLSRLGNADVAGMRPSSDPLTAGQGPADAPESRATIAPIPTLGPPHPIPPERVERLLPIADRALAGAPRLELLFRTGVDLDLSEWLPGTGLRTVARFPGAFEDQAVNENAVPDPAIQRVMLLRFDGTSTSTSSGTRARLVDRSGRVAWTNDEIVAGSGALWSADGGLVVTVGTGRRWHLTAIDDGGRARDQVVDLPAEIYLPRPIPIGSLSIPSLDPRTIPLGFSSDGRWIYGGLVSPTSGSLVGWFRVAVDGSVVERTLDLGVGRDDGLAPTPGTIGGSLVDHVSGRIANGLINRDVSGGAPTLDIQNPDSGFAFSIDASPLASGWGDDGALYVLSGAIMVPNDVQLLRVDAAGGMGPPLLSTGPIAYAALIDIRHGFAALAEWISGPAGAAQVILIDLADPSRVAAIELPSGEGLPSLVWTGLRE